MHATMDKALAKCWLAQRAGHIAHARSDAARMLEAPCTHDFHPECSADIVIGYPPNGRISKGLRHRR
jgi:hypothetical protein